MSKRAKKIFDRATKCCLTEQLFTSSSFSQDKNGNVHREVKDHRHLIGRYMVAAHSDFFCNANRPMFFPVLFHFVSNSDPHLFSNTLLQTKK